MKVLLTLLEMTAYSAVIFLLLAAVKGIFKRRISPLLHYALWAVFVIRLLIPVTMESPVHFITVERELPAQEVILTEEAEPRGEESLTAERPAGEELTPQVIPEREPQVTLLKTEAPKASLKAEHILLGVWIMGMLTGAAWVAYSYVQLMKKLRRVSTEPTEHLLGIFERVCEEMNLNARPKLCIVDGMTAPGVAFERLFMPAEKLLGLSDGEISMILRHELTHYKRRDQYISLLLTLLNIVYWFDPIVWIAVPWIRRDMETACDSAVVSALPAQEKKTYARLILELFSRSAEPSAVLAMSQGRGAKTVEKRIRGIFMKHKSNFGIKLISVCLVFLLGICCFTTACQPDVKVKTFEGAAENSAVENTEKEPVLEDTNLTTVLQKEEAPQKPLQQFDGIAWQEVLVTENGDKWTFDTRTEAIAAGKYRTDNYPVYKVTRKNFADEAEKYTESYLEYADVAVREFLATEPEDHRTNYKKVKEGVYQSERGKEVRFFAFDHSLIITELTNKDLQSERRQNLSDAEARKWDQAEIDEFQARMAAEKMLKKMGIEGFDVAVIAKAWITNGSKTDSYGYEVIFSRTQDEGIPVYLQYRGQDERFRKLAESYQKMNNEEIVYLPETIYIYVDETGIRYFGWEEAWEVHETMQTDIKMLPFAEIQNIIREAVMKSDRKDGTSYVVDRVSLMYHPVWVSDEASYHELRPVWMVFYNCIDGHEEPTDGKLAMAIDAETGKFIDYFC